MTTEQVHISRIKAGDTIIHNGVLTTVCANNIKFDTFIGTSLFGDSYNMGYKKVTRVLKIETNSNFIS
jgi:hypothetical protein